MNKGHQGQQDQGQVPARLSISVATTRRHRRAIALLGLILLLQAALSFTLACSNTAFQDEGIYLYIGRVILGQWTGGPKVATVEPYSFACYLSGVPWIYPPLGAVADHFGGLLAARLLSLLMLLTTNVLLFIFTRRCFGVRAALAASALFAASAPALFVGALATYDALCLLAIAATLNLATADTRWAVTGRGALRIGVVTGSMLTVAIAAKFAGLAFCLPAFYLLLRRNRWAVVYALLPIGILTAAAVCLDPLIVEGFNHTTLNRPTAVPQTTPELLRIIASLAGLPLLLAVVGARRLPRGYRRQGAFVLIGASLLAPLNHLYHGEACALHKHLAASVLFLSAPAGAFLAGGLRRANRTTLSSSRRAILSGALVLLWLAIATWGLYQAAALYHWANTTELVRRLRPIVNTRTRILSESYEVQRYALPNIPGGNWLNLYYGRYVGADGTVWETSDGTDATVYERALNAGFYDVIVLDGSRRPAVARELTRYLQQSRQYRRYAVIRVRDMGTWQTQSIWLRNNKASSTP